MRKLQAAMRDKSAKAWTANRTYYKVGSVFKGCSHCGEVQEDEDGKVKYLSGHNVFRSYEPSFVGWTWWCWDCGARDLQCWAPDTLGMVEAELGKPPVMGTREVKYEKKYTLRKELAKLDPAVRVREPSRAEQIAALEAEVGRLMAMLKGGK